MQMFDYGVPSDVKKRFFFSCFFDLVVLFYIYIYIFFYAFLPDKSKEVCF